MKVSVEILFSALSFIVFLLKYKKKKHSNQFETNSNTNRY